MPVHGWRQDGDDAMGTYTMGAVVGGTLDHLHSRHADVAKAAVPPGFVDQALEF